MSIQWGEARIPVDAYNFFKVGGHIISVDVPDGESVSEVAVRVTADLRRIADALFEQQRAWYEEKLGSMVGK